MVCISSVGVALKENRAIHRIHKKIVKSSQSRQGRINGKYYPYPPPKQNVGRWLGEWEGVEGEL
jgi:hypothetical protein